MWFSHLSAGGHTELTHEDTAQNVVKWLVETKAGDNLI